MEQSLQNICPLIRHAGQVPMTTNDLKRTRIAYDHRVFRAPAGGIYAVAGLFEGELQEDGVLLIGAGIPYRIGAKKGEAMVDSINFDLFGGPGKDTVTPLPLTDQEHFDPTLLMENEAFYKAFPEDGVAFVRADESIRGFMSSIIDEKSTAELAYRPAAAGLLTALLCRIYRESRLSIGVSQNKLLRYIASHIDSELSNREIARVFRYHPNYISSVIKAQTGMPLHQYVKRLRIRRAGEMLLYTTLSVEEVGRRVGYPDPSYFSHLFKRVTGYRPTELRGNRPLN